MRKRGSKKAELTSTQIALLIFAIVGFVIVAIFVSQLGFDQLSEQQVCHMSVLTRATVPSSAQAYAPLKCKTQKICLSDGGKCDASFAGEKIAPVISLNKEDSSAANQVADANAKAMYECWKMMGEGKLDLFHSLATMNGFDKAKPVCVICSRIAVDSSRADSVLSKVNMGEYLQTHQAPESSLTYLQAFTDKQVSSYAKIEQETLDKNFADLEKKGAEQFSFAATDKTPETAVIFMQIKPENYGEVFSNLVGLGGTAAGSAFVFAPITTAKGAWIAAKGIVRHPVVAAVAGAAAAGYVSLNVYQGRAAAVGRCGEVTIPGEGNGKLKGDSAKNGCSMVEVLPYDAKAINKICNYIESIP
jgi:hypothetical protein